VLGPRIRQSDLVAKFLHYTFIAGCVTEKLWLPTS